MPGNIVTIGRMIKFSHTVFALPFAVMAAFLAGEGGTRGFCGWGRLLLIVICMVTARSAAMTFNRIVDARFDAKNARTADRAIPTGQITTRQAWWFWCVCSVLFVGVTILFYRPMGWWFGYGNYWPVVLSVPVLAFICGYSYAKRFTWMSHFWLGASLMLAPVGAWIAVSPPTGPVTSVTAWLLGVAVLLWTAGFDIVYACQDVEVDRRDGLYSLPTKLGVASALWVSRTCHSLTITLLLLLALMAKLGEVYLAAVIITAMLLVVEHVLVGRGKMKHIRIAFGTVNGVISILLAVATIADIML